LVSLSTKSADGGHEIVVTWAAGGWRLCEPKASSSESESVGDQVKDVVGGSVSGNHKYSVQDLCHVNDKLGPLGFGGSGVT
jgi:hypothetical protein